MADRIPLAGRREAPAGSITSANGMAYGSRTGVPAGREVWGTHPQTPVLSSQRRLEPFGGLMNMELLEVGTNGKVL